MSDRLKLRGDERKAEAQELLHVIRTSHKDSTIAELGPEWFKVDRLEPMPLKVLNSCECGETHYLNKDIDEPQSAQCVNGCAVDRPVSHDRLVEYALMINPTFHLWGVVIPPSREPVNYAVPALDRGIEAILPEGVVAPRLGYGIGPLSSEHRRLLQRDSRGNSLLACRYTNPPLEAIYDILGATGCAITHENWDALPVDVPRMRSIMDMKIYRPELNPDDLWIIHAHSKSFDSDDHLFMIDMGRIRASTLIAAAKLIDDMKTGTTTLRPRSKK